MKLIVNQQYVEIMREHLEDKYPYEACGFFSGEETSHHREINDLWSVENKSPEDMKRKFLIDPLDYIKAEHKTIENQTNLLGLFHSHPDHIAFPSEHDLAAAQPYFSYVIASVYDGKLTEIRSFRLVDGKFVEEELIIKHKNEKS